MLNKKEINAKIDGFIEDWKNQKFPTLTVQFEGETYELFDILNDDYVGSREPENTKVLCFINNKGQDLRFSMNDKSIKFALDQPRLLSLINFLEAELSKVKPNM